MIGARATVVVTAALALAAPRAARADRRVAASSDGDAAAGAVVIVNAVAGWDGGEVDAERLERLRKELGGRGLLRALPAAVEAALADLAPPTDLGAVEDAYAAFDYDRAADLLEQRVARLIDGAPPERLARPLAELAYWHGLIAAAAGDDDAAAAQFRFALRLDDGLAVDRAHTPPRVRALFARARRETAEQGTLVLRVDASAAAGNDGGDDAGAAGAATDAASRDDRARDADADLDAAPDAAAITVAIDGGAPRPVPRALVLAAGLHLVAVTAPHRAPHAEIVDLAAGRARRLDVALAPERRADRVRHLADAAAGASDRARLRAARALGRLTGASRLLVVESAPAPGAADADATLAVRLYDLPTRSVSPALPLGGTAAVARMVAETSDGVDLSTLDADGLPPRPPPHWYQRWWVWAGVGAVVAGTFAWKELADRPPTSLRGF